MKQEPLKRRRPAARKRGQKQTLRAVVLSVLAVSVIALCLGIWTRLPGCLLYTSDAADEL